MNSMDRVTELRCNVDDMTGEDIAYAIEKIMEGGALDAFAAPVMMKKGRPGYLITVLINEDMKEEAARLIFTYTSTIGIRESVTERMVLKRSVETVATEYGDVRIKVSEGYGVKKCKPEYEDIRAIADREGLSTSSVREAVLLSMKLND